MGGRGASSGRGGGVFSSAIDRKINSLYEELVHRKTEKYHIIDENGNVIYQKSGTKRSVTIYDEEIKNIYNNKNGIISIHNHPDQGFIAGKDPLGVGGPFSTADLQEFNRNAKGIVVVAPEGIYKISKTKKTNVNGLIAAANTMYKIVDLESTERKIKAERQAAQKYKENTNEFVHYANKIILNDYMNQTTNFYKQNAKKYGFNFQFIPKK